MVRRLMSKMHVLSLGILSIGMLSACGSQSLSEGPASDPKIYGGFKVANGEWMNTVAVVNGGSIFCTGTLLHPELVVTAAHCVKGYSAKNMTVYIGPGLSGGKVKGQYKVTKSGYSPRYKGLNSDVAYLVLEKPVTELRSDQFIQPLVDKDEISELLEPGGEATLVGFGYSSKGVFGLGGKFGEKNQVDVVVGKITQNEIFLGGNGKDSCQGDSGGPAFGQLSNGEWRVYGVVSRGGACGTGGIYGLIHDHVCWLQEASGVDLQLTSDNCGGTVQVPNKQPQVQQEQQQNDPWWW